MESPDEESFDEESFDEESFDPYVRWLGIRDPQRPVNYYRLLGIDANESDADVIATAADRQMSHIRRYQVGQYAQQSQDLLNELAAARLALLDPGRRAEYDCVHQVRDEAEQGSRSRWRYAVAGLLVTVCIVWLSMSYFGSEPTKERIQNVPSGGATAATADVTPNEREATDESSATVKWHGEIEEVRAEDVTSSVSETGGASEVNGSAQVDATVPAVETTQNASISKEPEPSEERPDFVELDLLGAPASFPRNGSVWADVKQAISERDFDGATSELIDAEGLVETTEDEENHTTLSEILGCSKQFWFAVQQALEGAVPVGTLLEYGDLAPIRVDSIDGQTIVLSAPDRSQVHYPARPESLPPVIAAGLAGRVLPDAAKTHLVLGTFWSFDERGNVDQANRHWRLLRGDERPLRFLKVWRSMNEPNQSASAGSIPNAEEFNRLSRQIEQRLRVKRDNPAPTAADRLVDEANRRAKGSPARYVCLRRAALYASMAGRAAFVMNTLRALDTEYPPIRNSDRIELINLLVRNVPTDSAHLVARTAIIGATRAIDSDKYKDAATFSKLALKAARRTDGTATIDQATALSSRATVLRRAYQRTLRSRQKLEIDPDDRAANRVVGEFLCFKKGDFEAGLPLLAKSNANQRELARQTLNVADRLSTTDQLSVADEWWHEAARMGKFEQEVVRGYAGTLYRGLSGKLQGKAKERVIERLKTVRSLSGQP